MTLSSLCIHLFTVWRVWPPLIYPDGGKRWFFVSWGELSENSKYSGVYKVSLWGVIFLKHSGVSLTRKWSARHTLRIHFTWLYCLCDCRDAWITIKLSAVNNRLCEMSMLCCCCFFLSESDSALDWRWHLVTVWPDTAVIYSTAVTQLSKLLSLQKQLWVCFTN